MGKIVEFRRPDRRADVEKLLREFYAEERELENDEALQERARRANCDSSSGVETANLRGDNLFSRHNLDEPTNSDSEPLQCRRSNTSIPHTLPMPI